MPQFAVPFPSPLIPFPSNPLGGGSEDSGRPRCCGMHDLATAVILNLSACSPTLTSFTFANLTFLRYHNFIAGGAHVQREFEDEWIPTIQGLFLELINLLTLTLFKILRMVKDLAKACEASILTLSIRIRLDSSTR